MDVAEIYLGDLVQDNAEPQPDWPAGYALSADALRSRAGSYVSTIRPANVTLAVGDGDRLRIGGTNGDVLVPRSETEFEVAGEDGTLVVFDDSAGAGQGAFSLYYEGGLIDSFVPAGRWRPSADDLEDFVGVY